MAKNEEFDLDFDFEKEYGFDPRTIMDPEYEEMDLSFDDDFLKDVLSEEGPAPAPEAPAPAPEEPEFDLNDPLFAEDVPEIDLNDPIFNEDTPAFDLNASLYAQEEPEFDMNDPIFEPEIPAEETVYAPPAAQWEPQPAAPNWEPEAAEPVPAEEETPAAEEAPPAPRPQRRRRKRSKLQKFKEHILPPIIAGLALILCIVFIAGSVSRNTGDGNQDDESQNASESEQNEADRLAAEIARIEAQAAELAAGYDYQAAIAVLDSFGDLSGYPELLSAKANYSQQMTQLVEWNNPSEITNLSFHCLIADPSRAFTDASLGTKYNKNFVTIDEFEKILEQLYNNGYVLVDLDDVILETAASDGTITYSANSILLPAGKKPIMITETLVNYFGYMIDSDDDGIADAGGAGFASRLVVQNGEIKAEMVTSTGETVVGNYDLVPILEDFIKAHPDFSYKGARATLAVSGEEGVFGYRINKGDEAEVAGAKEVIAALQDKGYTIACYTYANTDYNQANAIAIQSDLQKWTQEITPVLGSVDILVFAQGIDIAEYTGNKFNVLYSSGFRYFLGASNSPWAEVTNTYFHQKRLMVTGNQMAYSSNTYAKYFNALSIMNDQRGTVPN